ncbi:hypothetical protein BDV95DRAFT_559897 [Massariosphaeria phaeospora]|uniref:FAD-binding domain-containing protein n=1 Tax=Massariosphaeria phaeospora TaxID=100035 RepID=A0A7C8II29_9PLEO|nr:hypothetical protein BDV95DRAFT_559897 [Massariosphaeria phaeospora]
MAPRPISIVGAGIGGLTLGRSLLKQGIPTVLYERAPSTPRHGYSITLHASAYRSLLDVLDMDERTFRGQVAVDRASGGVGDINHGSIVDPRHISTTSFRAHRGRFERLLREGLDIRWEHAVEAVRETSSGLVLWLQDGRRFDSGCVIAADGPHSPIWKSLSSATSLRVLPFVAFSGKRLVPRAVFDSIYASSLESSNLVELNRAGVVFQVQVSEHQEEHASISWVYSRSAKGPTDVLHKPDRPMSGATDMPKEFFHEIAALRDLPQPFKEMFEIEKLKTDRILHWLMRVGLVSMQELQRLAKKEVFFMGDAVHVEPIIGGQGANVAVTDGLELAECIAKSGTKGLSEWYKAQYPDWEMGVSRSERVIREKHGEHGAGL